MLLTEYPKISNLSRLSCETHPLIGIRQFECRLKTDKQLSKEVNLHKEIDLFLECDALKNTLEDIHRDYVSEEKIGIHFLKKDTTPTPVKTGKLKKWLAAASITFLLISGGGITYHFQTRDSLENRLYAAYYEPFDKTGKFVLNSSALNLAQQKYMNGEYMNAFLLFQELPMSLTIENERHFYIGLSLMELEQYKKAIISFEQVQKGLEDLEYLTPIQWYKGLCYLKTGDKEKAIDIFNTIIKNNDYNNKKAKKILRRLKK